jgi:hypothetical protein
MAEHTEKGGVETAAGFIPHLKIGKFQAPVKLDFSTRYEEGYKPLTRDGNLVYALPGGGEIAVSSDHVAN